MICENFSPAPLTSAASQVRKHFCRFYELTARLEVTPCLLWTMAKPITRGNA